jgi:hypothetical protein
MEITTVLALHLNHIKNAGHVRHDTFAGNRVGREATVPDPESAMERILVSRPHKIACAATSISRSVQRMSSCDGQQSMD